MTGHVTQPPPPLPTPFSHKGIVYNYPAHKYKFSSGMWLTGKRLISGLNWFHSLYCCQTHWWNITKLTLQKVSILFLSTVVVIYRAFSAINLSYNSLPWYGTTCVIWNTSSLDKPLPWLYKTKSNYKVNIPIMNASQITLFIC